MSNLKELETMDNKKLELYLTSIKIEYGRKGQLYATMAYKGEEVGYIDPTGIYIRLYNPKTPFGTIWKLPMEGDGKEFHQLCNFMIRHFDAVYDRYDLLVKHER